MKKPFQWMALFITCAMFPSLHVAAVRDMPSQGLLKLPAAEKTAAEEKSAASDDDTLPLTLDYEEIAQCYSLEGEKYLYHPVTEETDIRSLLEQMRFFFAASGSPQALDAKDGVLLFTKDGRRLAFYVNKKAACTSKRALTGDSAQREGIRLLCEQMNEKYPAVPRWIAYMDPAKITRIQYSAFSTRSAAPQGGPRSILLDLQAEKNPDEIKKAAALLKSLYVNPNSVRLYPDLLLPYTTADLESCLIHFNTGVRYTFFGSGGGLSLSSSDMGNVTLQYDFADPLAVPNRYSSTKQDAALRDGMEAIQNSIA